ncbi:MAG: class I SAM-dependent methyltransferase [Nitrospirae bacterium]|nr:class I SAM-dependent methyltransferase [Nitrospirota bacterium]
MTDSADVSVTAFIVNESRARLEQLSGDVYAKLWVTDETRRLWEEFSCEVYPHDHVNLSLRHLFFLERLRDFIRDNDSPLFVNVAAGFTSYPFLLPPHCRCVETDFAHIMNFKKQNILQWQQSGIVPSRTTRYYPLDLESAQERESFRCTLDCGGRPGIVIMEGLVYYLSMDALNSLFEIYAAALPEGSLVLFDFWGPEADSYPVVRGLRQYLSRRSCLPPCDFAYIDMQYINSIEGFAVREHTDIAALERRYANSRVLQDRDSRFPGEYVVLEKRLCQPVNHT